MHPRPQDLGTTPSATSWHQCTVELRATSEILGRCPLKNSGLNWRLGTIPNRQLWSQVQLRQNSDLHPAGSSSTTPCCPEKCFEKPSSTSSLAHGYPLLPTEEPCVPGEQPELFQPLQKEEKPTHFLRAGPSLRDCHNSRLSEELMPPPTGVPGVFCGTRSHPGPRTTLCIGRRWQSMLQK